jgi:hypothetical protein
VIGSEMTPDPTACQSSRPAITESADNTRPVGMRSVNCSIVVLFCTLVPMCVKI